MSSPEPRARLAALQSHLLRSLTSEETPPADFDAHRVRSCAVSLLHKRAGTAGRVLPALEHALGKESFRERFVLFARTVPLPGDASPISDAYAFARTLPSSLLDEAARCELLRITVRYRWTVSGLRPRRGFCLRAMRFGGRRLLLVRLPFVGVLEIVI